MSSPFSIILAEDNAADVFLVRTALKEEGLSFNLQVFSNGEEVLRFLQQVEAGSVACPDLLLLDLNLPRYSGEEILEWRQKSGRCSALSVVVLTSSDSLKDRARAALLGAARYFRKPADLEEFMKLGAIVKDVLR